jgi:hypothetical protein
MPERADHLNPPESALADALKALGPASTTISRDRLLFEAGRAAAVPRFIGIWPGAAVLFAGVSLALGVFIVIQAQRPMSVVERERIVEVRVEVPAALPGPETPLKASSGGNEDTTHADTSPSPETVRMFQVRRDVLDFGPEMLPNPKPVANPMSPADTAREIDRWLDVPPGTFTAPYLKAPRLFPSLLGG